MAWLDPGTDGCWMDSPHGASDAVSRVLTGEGSGGLILTGEAGDRRETIEAAMAEVPSERAVYRLHGSPFAAATPYGALSILLSGLDEAPAPTLHAMIRALADFVRPSGQLPAIVIVSQADQIDTGTITVLAQLAQLERITLVVHGERLTDVPVDLTALLRAGTLEGITVWPLSPTAAGDLLEDVLDGPVSRFAATVLWRHSGGSISRLRQLARDCVTSGKLHRAEAGWVLTSGPLPRLASTGPQPASMRHLPARQRALLEMLAICGPMRVSDLIHIGYAHELDELQDSGALEIRHGHSGRSAAVSPDQAAEALAAIEPDRRRELALTLESLDPGYLSVLRAADDLMTVGDFQGAVSLFAETGWKSPERSRPTHSTALMHLAWAETRTRVAMGDLDGAEAVVRQAPESTSAALNVLGACVDVARGDVAQAHSRLDAVSTDHRPELLGPGLSGYTIEAVRCRAEATRAEALALADDQDGALRIIAWLDRELTEFRARGILDDVLSPFTRACLAESVLTVLLTCGQLDRCRQAAEALIESRHGNPQSAQYAELVLSALEALTGQRDQAHQRVSRLAAQLELVGNPQDLQVARAIMVFCDAGEADESKLLEALVEGQAEPATAQPLGRLGWVAELMLAWSAGQFHSAEARTARTLALADRAAAAGLHAIEYSALAWAFHSGELQLAERLAEAAANTQTTASRPTLLLARSVIEDDRDLRVEALEALAAAGFAGHVHRMESPLFKSLTPQMMRRIADAAASAPGQRSPVAEGPEGDSVPEWMVELTRREREIARLVVDGKTNAVIARISGISIRTVEGHLYQIYAKLHLKGRAELTRLATAHATSGQSA